MFELLERPCAAISWCCLGTFWLFPISFKLRDLLDIVGGSFLGFSLRLLPVSSQITCSFSFDRICPCWSICRLCYFLPTSCRRKIYFGAVNFIRTLGNLRVFGILMDRIPLFA